MAELKHARAPLASPPKRERASVRYWAAVTR